MYKAFLTILIALTCIAAKAQQADLVSPGSYYTTSGEKKTGFIYIEPGKNHLYFKPDEHGHYVKIKVEDIKAVVIPLLKTGGWKTTVVQGQTDSLVVETEDGKDDKKYFAMYNLATPVTTFYYKGRENTYGGAGTAAPSYSRTVVKQTSMYSDGNTTHELTKSNYIDILSKAFADVPGLVQRIQNKEFRFKELDDLFNEYKQESKVWK